LGEKEMGTILFDRLDKSSCTYTLRKTAKGWWTVKKYEYGEKTCQSCPIRNFKDALGFIESLGDA